MSEDWRNDPRFIVKEKLSTPRKKALKAWNELPPLDKNDYYTFEKFFRSNDWKDSSDMSFNPRTGSFDKLQKVKKDIVKKSKPGKILKKKTKIKKKIKKEKKSIFELAGTKTVWAHCSNNRCRDYTQMYQIPKVALKRRTCSNCLEHYMEVRVVVGGKPVMPQDGTYDKSINQTPKSKFTYESQIRMFGQEYDYREYVDWLSKTRSHYREIHKNTDYEDYPFNFTNITKGSFWNSDRIYPKTRNEFIAKFFKNRDPKGLEGLWKMENWGVIGAVKEKLDLKKGVAYYYQIYNISIQVPRIEAQKGAIESFFDGILGEESPKEISYNLVNGTKDCAWIPTANKNKFKWEGRNVYLIPTTDNMHIFANEEETMELNVLGNNLVNFVRGYGNDEPAKAQRIWPEVTQEDEITSQGVAQGPTSGTGFFIDNMGHVITNYHVVAPCNDKQKIIYKNKEVNAKLIAKDEMLDLALLKTDITNNHYIKISNKPLKKLQSVIAAGYPGGKALSDDLKFTSGIISSLKGFKDNSSQIQIDAALNMGNSGGPIVDSKNGELAAVAVSMLRNEIVEGINFGIKVSQVRDFLYANQIDTDKIAKKHKDKDLNNILENSTVYVFCN